MSGTFYSLTNHDCVNMLVMTSSVGRSEADFECMGSAWQAVFQNWVQHAKIMKLLWEEPWYCLMPSFRAASKSCLRASHRVWILCCQFIVKNKLHFLKLVYSENTATPHIRIPWGSFTCATTSPRPWVIVYNFKYLLLNEVSWLPLIQKTQLSVKQVVCELNSFLLAVCLLARRVAASQLFV